MIIKIISLRSELIRLKNLILAQSFQFQFSMLPQSFFVLIKWLRVRSSEHLDLPTPISMEERFTCFQILALHLLTLQKGIIAQKCLNHLSAHHVDRNVPESARKSYQHVSESGAAIMMLWDLPVKKKPTSETPLCQYSCITLHHFGYFQDLCTSFILQEGSKAAQLKACIYQQKHSMTGSWRICLIKNNVNYYIPTKRFLFSQTEKNR